MDTITRQVDDLSTPDRAAIEHLLGKSLESDQRVVIIAYTATEADPLVRAAAKARIEAALARATSHAVSAGILAAEADEAIADAMEVIRPRPGF